MTICPGIYQLAEARDGLLARVRLPGGRISPAGLVALAGLSAQHGNGAIDLTNRANLQVRGLSTASGPKFAAGLAAAGLAAENPARDRLRNILANPLAGIAPDTLIDVDPLVDALDKTLLTASNLDHLSPKFSFLFDGGDAAGVAALAYDAGFLAEMSPNGPVFRLGLANSATGMVLSPAAALNIALAAARLAASKNARMADLLKSEGIDTVLSQIGQGQLVPRARPEATHRAMRGAPHGLLPDCGAVAIGFAGVSATADVLAAIGRFAIDATAGSIRVTPWRGLIIAGLADSAAPALLALAAELGLMTAPSAVETVACVGARGCLRTTFQTEAAAEAIRTLTENWNGSEKAIQISGCERGCARPGMADLLVIGRDSGGKIELHRRTSAGSANAETLIGVLGPATADIAEGVLEALNVGG